MQVSTSPTLVPLPFADSGAKNVIPEAASPTPGLASLTTGFPPVTMTPLAAGGIPPAGQDMNGILNLISQTTRWTQAGGPFAYNAGFATDSNVNGYPQGAVISRADYTGQWISTVDNNTVNPDTVGTNWVPGYNYGVTAVTGLTNANVTLTPAQAAKSRITLAGTLTGNVQIILPTWTRDWTIVNNTTGAFTITCKTAAGTGVAIPQDASPTKVTGDGTNITQLAENVAPATQSQHALQLGQATGRLLNVQVFNGSGTYTPTAGMKTAIVEVQGAGGGSGGAPATSTGQYSGSSGSSSGTYTVCLLTAAQIGASQSVTIGAAGTAGASGFSTGGNGGTSSLGTLISCPGGLGSTSYGPTGTTVSISNAIGTNTTAPTTAGTVIQVTQGSVGSGAVGSTSGVLSPPGGISPMARATNGPGAGAQGTALPASTAAVAGVAGGAGKIVIWEYA